MTSDTVCSALLLLILTACDDTVCIPTDDEAGGPALTCDVDVGITIDKPVDCMILGCNVDRANHATCSFVLWLPEGEDGEIGIRLAGGSELPWNELPWNLEAGAFEDSYLIGEGTMCGGFELDLPAEWSYIEMSCTNWNDGFDIDTWTKPSP
jgi:hypothetical protein